jgi:hypothetical protein
LVLVPREGRRSGWGREDEGAESGVMGVGKDGVDGEGDEEVWDLGGTPII